MDTTQEGGQGGGGGGGGDGGGSGGRDRALELRDACQRERESGSVNRAGIHQQGFRQEEDVAESCQQPLAEQEAAPAPIGRHRETPSLCQRAETYVLPHS